MPLIRPISAIGYKQALNRASANGNPVDVSAVIAPPYDVLDAQRKSELLDQDEHNIVAVDLPHLPAKTVGPDETYLQAGKRFKSWIDKGVLVHGDKPALFVYQQTYEASKAGKVSTFRRRGLMANVRLQEFGPAPEGSEAKGGVYPHEQTFASAKEDRLKLMRATGVQMSPIFGMYGDPQGAMTGQLEAITQIRHADFAGRTPQDNVLHEVWTVDDPQTIDRLSKGIADVDVFIADGHHRYNTALMYRNELKGDLDDDHPANQCLFVLVAIQDPGMIVLPTHRVLGGMSDFSMAGFIEASQGKLQVEPFETDKSGDDALGALEAALPKGGQHAIGLYGPDKSLWVATTCQPDPLAENYARHSYAWRQLDVSIVQHLIVEQICQPNFCGEDQTSSWKFPHTFEELRQMVDSGDYQMGLIMQATPLDAVRQISEAGELMPQKSTFFYPKLATGLVVNPLQ